MRRINSRILNPRGEQVKACRNVDSIVRKNIEKCVIISLKMTQRENDKNFEGNNTLSTSWYSTQEGHQDYNQEFRNLICTVCAIKLYLTDMF